MKTIKKTLWLLLLVIAMLLASRAHGQDKSLCRTIASVASAYNLDASEFTALLVTESNLKVSAVNNRTKDYGIGQINVKTIAAYSFDKTKLLTDSDYSVNASAKVLHHFKRRFKRTEPTTWMCRYNVGTGVLSNKRAMNCLKYLNKLAKAKEQNKCLNFDSSTFELVQRN